MCRYINYTQTYFFIIFKRLISILAICLLVINFSEEGRIATAQERVRSFKKIATVSEVLNNESIRKFVTDSILQNPPRRSPYVITKIAPLRFNIVGLTTEIKDGVYLIQLNSIYPVETLQRTMFHELVHVLQFDKRYLIEAFGEVFWRGERSTWNVPWGNRPWEIHAEKLTNQLFVPSCEEDK